MKIFTVATCPSLSLENGQVQYEPENAEHQTGTVVFFTCNEGYMRTGSLFSTCQDSGTWDQEIPSCIEGIEMYTLIFKLSITTLDSRWYILPKLSDSLSLNDFKYK